MIALRTRDRNDFTTAQKAHVSCSSLHSFFKYVTIPIAEELRIVCHIIPQQMQDELCYASVCVVQYLSLPNLAPLFRQIPPFVQHFCRSDIRILDTIVDSKTVDVSLIVSKSSSVRKWRSATRANEIIRNILQLFVVTSSCVVKVPWREEDGNDIVFICVNATGSRRNACRITSSTVVNIEEIMSVDKFKLRCTNEPVHVAGLASQLRFLNSIYQANVNLKKSKEHLAECIQKVLIIGPPGCGKTTLVNSFAKSKKCGLVVVEGSQLAHVTPGESENILCSFFDEAIDRSREGDEEICIVHLDQVENICRKSKSAASHLGRISGQLFQILDTIGEHPGVIVIATTSDVHSLDPVLRRSSRIQTEIHIGMPDEKERQEILYFHDGSLNNVTCKKIAACTVGYNGADLAFLVQNVRRLLDKNEEHTWTEAEILSLYSQCLRTHIPSAMRGGLGTVRLRDTQMSHLGGLNEAKSVLERYVDWPLKYSNNFRKLGIPVPKGILLYGPPGCAKTSLVCAIANATNTTFLAVSAAQLYASYVGEAEKNVVELFHKARMNSPCILFIDEIDALVGNRETSSKSVQTKILSTFLTEMDGFDRKIDWSTKSRVVGEEESEETKENSNLVIVIAATNRPDKLDSAILRPGRFDKLVYVKPPNMEERLDILRTLVDHTKIPLSSCVNLTEIAEKTEHFSGADLKSLMTEAGYKALLEGGMSVQHVKHEHILESLHVVPASGSKDSYSQHFERFKTG